MLVLYIFILMFTNSINHLQKNIHCTYINRITIITLLFSILYTFNSLYFQSIGKGISIYNGLFQTTIQSQLAEILLIIVGVSIFLSWPYLLIKGARCSPRQAATEASDKQLQQASKALRMLGQSVPSFLLSTAKEGISSPNKRMVAASSISKSDQYSLIAIFSILGGSLLMSSLDLLSMYLSIELQSFALYILATLHKDKLSATSAGLKYFLLGSLSSCFILLGSAIIYSYTGLTQFEAINTLLSVPTYNDILTSAQEIAAYNQHFGQITTEGSVLIAALGEGTHLLDINKAFTIGFIVILIGFLFKISAAPFYQWAPDVYDGTPTIVTVWLTIVVKLTILIFLQGVIEFSLPSAGDTVSLINNYIVKATGFSSPSFMQGLGGDIPSYIAPLRLGSVQIKNLLLISSLLSLLVGTIAGLSQIKVKRLLAFSSISHVGFLLLALGIYTQKSVDSFIFYLVQYSITSLNIFLILLAFGYLLYSQVWLSQEGTSRPNVYQLKLGSTTVSQRAEPEIDLAYSSSATNSGFRAEEQRDLNYLIELKGQLHKNPVLSTSLAICLFSMAGIPPLIGFFSKQFVLFSSIENGNYFLSIVAILVSVISASYYLKLIKITFFVLPLAAPAGAALDKKGMDSNSSFSASLCDAASTSKEEGKQGLSYYQHSLTSPAGEAAALALTCPGEEGTGHGNLYLSNVHSYLIAILTFIILFFFLDPSILLNGTQLISLTIFNL